MDLVEIFCIFLAGFTLRDIIGMNCLAGALARIEMKLGTGEYEHHAEPPEDPAAAFRRAEGAE